MYMKAVELKILSSHQKKNIYIYFFHFFSVISIEDDGCSLNLM